MCSNSTTKHDSQHYNLLALRCLAHAVCFQNWVCEVYKSELLCLLLVRLVLKSIFVGNVSTGRKERDRRNPKGAITIMAQDFRNTSTDALTYEFPEMDNIGRLRELILYVSDRCTEDPGFGATKLNKILYFADFFSYATYGEPVTGAKYMRIGQGPVPQAMLPVRSDMEEKMEIFIRKHKVFGGNYEQHRVIAMREPDISMFRARDIAIVDEVIRVLWGRKASEVSDLSHGIAWKIYNDRQLIPYEASLLSDQGITQGDIIRAQELIMEHGWNV